MDDYEEAMKIAEQYDLEDAARRAQKAEFKMTPEYREGYSDGYLVGAVVGIVATLIVPYAINAAEKRIRLYKAKKKASQK